MGQITRTLASGSTAVIDPETGKVTAILKKPKASTGKNDRKPPRSGREKCGHCANGVYYISGAMVNGKFVGKTGKCFQCQGKGYTTPDDRRRTNNYYRYYWRPLG